MIYTWLKSKKYSFIYIQLAIIMSLIISITLFVIVHTSGYTASAASNYINILAAKRANRLHSLLPKSIQQSGKIIDVINSPYAPMEFSPPGSTSYTGFDIDLAKAVAKKLGVTLVFQNVQFPQVIPSVKTHRGDMAWTAVLDLKAREKSLNFIDYFKTGAQLYTSAANASIYRSVKDLCGKAVVVPSGTHYFQIVQNLSKSWCKARGSIQILQVASPAEEQLQIQEGRAAAAMIGAETILYTMRQHPGRWTLISHIFEPDYYGIVFAKDSSQLMKAVYAGLQAAFHDGTYRRILRRWGLLRAGLKNPHINAALH